MEPGAQQRPSPALQHVEPWEQQLVPQQTADSSQQRLPPLQDFPGQPGICFFDHCLGPGGSGGVPK